MTHLSSKELVAFFSLLSSSNIQKNAEHAAVDHPLIFTLASGRNPSDLLADQDSKIDFVRPDYCAARDECISHPVAIRGVDMRR